MKNTTQNKTAVTRPEKIVNPKLQTKNSTPTWKPQPCGISREDMRQIVLEMIG